MLDQEVTQLKYRWFGNQHSGHDVASIPTSSVDVHLKHQYEDVYGQKTKLFLPQKVLHQ